MRTFFSEHSIRAAQQWHDEIGAALARCDWFIVVLSPHALTSRWLKLELVYALQHERYNGRIVPLLQRTCDPERISWTLGAFQHVDFRRDFDAGCDHLLSLWEMTYRAH